MAFQNSSHVDAHGGNFVDVHAGQLNIAQSIHVNNQGEDGAILVNRSWMFYGPLPQISTNYFHLWRTLHSAVADVWLDATMALVWSSSP
jgi:hypothetical protein